MIPKGAKIRTEKGYSNWVYLYVNDVHIGTTYQEKIWRNPEKWAETQFKKRMAVIKRNVARLESELRVWDDEEKQLFGLYDSSKNIT